MTIYGTKAAKLTVEPITDRCLNCNTVHTMDMHIFQKYAHVLSVPVFPIKKTGVTLCAHCRQVLRKKEMSGTLLTTFDKVKAETSMPLWTWMGSILILLLVMYSTIFQI